MMRITINFTATQYNIGEICINIYYKLCHQCVHWFCMYHRLKSKYTKLLFK